MEAAGAGPGTAAVRGGVCRAVDDLAGLGVVHREPAGPRRPGGTVTFLRLACDASHRGCRARPWTATYACNANSDQALAKVALRRRRIGASALPFSMPAKAFHAHAAQKTAALMYSSYLVDQSHHGKFTWSPVRGIPKV